MEKRESSKELSLLLIEDNSGDSELVAESIRAEKLPIRLHVVPDGQKGLEFLRREGDYLDSPSIDVVILDLNLPRMSGLEVLQQIRQDGRFCDVPVIIFSSSSYESDIRKSYEGGANAFLRKPAQLSGFVEMLEGLKAFWSLAVKLPKSS